jgi:hypothetical protein
MKHLVTVPKAYQDNSRKHDVADCVLQGAYYTLTAFTSATPLNRRTYSRKTKRKTTDDTSSQASSPAPKRQRVARKPKQTELEEFLI